ncbi:hypothetical protein BKA65DRAFT_549449 [Rhexocercosporidium sp. MPI-PUGE-AT-0058]|nr:hypothetical protein BKA65DRAFT_549449 [Rhexocercosporidium sp. MPI-PUGE-AT-0058]
MASSDPSTSNRELLTSGPVPANPFTYLTGDTKILVTYKGKKMEGLVSSHSLCQASPVWKNFIYPLWDIAGQENVAGGAAVAPKAVDCSEGDGDALLILMNIVHLNFGDVPKNPYVQNLERVSHLSEQYQCVSVSNHGLRHDVILLCTIAEDIIEHMGLMDGKPFDCDGEAMTWLMPPGILDRILKVRLDMIDAILAIPYSQMSLYETTGNQCRATRTAPAPRTNAEEISFNANERALCDITSHGGLLRGLLGNDLWPRKNASDISMSSFELGYALKKMVIPCLSTFVRDTQTRLDHRKCFRAGRIDVDMTAVMKKVEILILDSHREHMRVQRAKLGMRDKN